MAEYIDKKKTTHEMWQNLYELEEKLEKEHGLDICERHNVQIGFEAGLEAVVNMPTIDIPDTSIEFETPREQLAFICGAILEKQKRNAETE